MKRSTESTLRIELSRSVSRTRLFAASVFLGASVAAAGAAEAQVIQVLAGETRDRINVPNTTTQVDNAGTISCPIVPTNGCGRTRIFGDVPYDAETNALLLGGSGQQILNRATGVLEGFIGGNDRGSSIPTNLTIDNFGTIRNSYIRLGEGGVLNLHAGSTFTNSIATGVVLDTTFIPTGNPTLRTQRANWSSDIETTLALKGPGAGAVNFQFSDMQGIIFASNPPTLQQAFNMKRLSVDGGTWTATGANTSFQTATVTSGATLVLDGSITGALTVAAGGNLSGTGTAGATTINGAVAPGHSVGTFNTGAVTFGAGSTYNVEIATCGTFVCGDLIAALGPAILDGTVRISVPTNFSTPFTDLAILTAPSITGQFAAIVPPSSNPFRQYSLTYHANSVLLSMALVNGCIPNLTNQSGTAGARLAVGCQGSSVLPQGDGTNAFIDIVVDGTLAMVPFPPPAINLDANNTVLLNGSITNANIGIRVGSSNTVTVAGNANTGGTGVLATGTGNVFGNVITVASGGQVGGYNGIAIQAGGSATGNTVNVDGTAVGGGFDIGSAVSIRGDGGAENNTVIVNGQITSTGANGIEVTAFGAGAVRNNTVTINAGGAVNGGGLTTGISLRSASGGIASNTISVVGSITSFIQGIDLRSDGNVTGNTVNVASTSTIRTNSTAPGMLLQANGQASQNAVNVSGTIASSATQIGIDLRGATGVNSNTITLASTGRVQGVKLTGPSTGNLIDNSGVIACLPPNTTCTAPMVEITAGSNNVLTNRAGATISGLVRTTGSTGFTFNNSGTLNGRVELGGSSTISHMTGASLNADVVGAGDSILALGGTGAGAIALERFAGMGNLTVNSGDWTGTGAATGFLAALINGGSLTVNGSLSATTTVGASGRLAGTGTVGALTVNGTVAPAGQSIGTLNVAGSVGFNAGSVYALQVSGCGTAFCADRIIATGAATLNSGANVSLALPSGQLPSFSLPILNASSVTGQFAALSQPAGGGLFRRLELVYQPTQVLLNLTNLEFDTAAQSANQISVANALDAAGSSGGAHSALQSLQSASEAQAAFDTLSGVTHAAVPRANEYAFRMFSGLAMDRLDNLENQGGGQGGEYAQVSGATMNDASPIRNEGGLRPWTSAFSAVGHIGGALSRPRTEYDVSGLLLGLETNLPDWTIGGAIGFGATDGDTSPDAFEATSVEGQAYAGWSNGQFELRGVAGIGQHDIDTRRLVSVGATTQTAIASYKGWTWGGAVELGAPLSMGGMVLMPFGGLDYLHSSRDGFTENQSSVGNLVVPESSENFLRGSIGAWFRTEAGLFDGLMWPSLRVAYAQDLMDEAAPFSGGFVGSPAATFAVEGAAFGKERVLAGAEVAFDLGTRTTFSISYDGEFAEDDGAHSGSINFRTAF